MDAPLRLALVGADGRVGRLIREEVAHRSDLELVAALTRADRDLPTCDVVIDFSLPAGTAYWAKQAADAGTPFMSGTTGLDDDANNTLEQASQRVAVLHATNTSLGVALLNRLAADAARILGSDFDCEIVEAHHRHKRDAPSGTADTLAAYILDARQQDAAALRFGRHGNDAIRQAGSIGVHSLRLGDVVGRHEAHFAGVGERLCVWHEATDRRTFARGALRAAQWLTDKAAGRYTMDDVLDAAMKD